MDKATFWYENNPNMIFVFDMNKWMDRRDYLIQHPEKFNQHKKFISERIQAYIKELL